MLNIKRSLLAILALAFLLLISQQGSAEDMAQYKRLRIRIPPFSMTAGDKIVGFKLTLTNGRATQSVYPRGWNCQLTGVAGRKQTLYCFAPNSSLAITMSERLPEMSILDMSSVSGNPLGVEVTVEIENNFGKEYSKEFQESDLSITP